MLTTPRRLPPRTARGNMIIVTCAFLCLFIVIMLFALSFVRLAGGQHQQKTAIEAAALAAATDVSRIVILDPNFGYVSFSDIAPVGTATTAGDNYYMPVSSINSLMGTIRLDLTIANALNNSTMKAMAQRDLTNLLAAKNNLITAINASLVSGGSGQDANGNTISPYADALSAYNNNRINMTGSSSYVVNSMALTLGSLPTGDTNIPIPSPASYANCSSSQQSNGYYLPNVDVPTSDGTDFVFAALGNTAKLVDCRNFQTTIAGLPYNMPSVVKVEADQTMNDNGAQRTIHAAAAAQGNNCYDPRPAPGALSFSFPDGTPIEVGKPIDLLNPPFTSGVPTTGQSPKGGDYPTDIPLPTLGPITWTGPTSPPDPAGGVSTGIYDWMKRHGPKLKVDAMLAMVNTPFTFSGMSADNILATNLYTADANGNIVYSTRELSDPGIAPPNVGSYNPAAGPAGGADPISVVSDQQLFITAQNALSSKDGFVYDMYVRDADYNPGTVKGGKHGGEPLTNSVLTATATHVSPANMTIASADLEPIKIASGTACSGSAYDCGGSGDGAHWGIHLGGPPGVVVAELDITTPDGHPLSFYVYSNAINTRNDFGQPLSPVAYYTFSVGPTALGSTRPTYLQNGLVSEIRMRRAIPLAKTGLTGFGYADFGHRTYPPPPPYPISPAFSLP